LKSCDGATYDLKDAMEKLPSAAIGDYWVWISKYQLP